MAIIYEYDKESGIISTEASGVISTGDMRNYVSEIIGCSDIMSGFIEVVDIEKVEDFVFKYSDTGTLKNLWPQFLEKGCVCSIIHAPADVGYGLMRMLQTVLLVDEDSEFPMFVVTRTREDILEHIKKLRS